MSGALSPLSRRTLIKRGLFGGVLLALGGGVGLALQRGRPAIVPSEGLLVLSAPEYAVIEAIAERLLPPRAGFPRPGELRVAFNADRILARAEEGVRRELKQLIGLFESALAGLVFDGRLRPFTRSPPEAQDAALEDWKHSRLALRRTGFEALRTLVYAAYYGSPATWSAVGYPGPPAGLHDPDSPVWRGVGPRPAGGP